MGGKTPASITYTETETAYPSPWLRTDAAAEYCGVSINVLSRAAQRGDVTSSKVGKTRLYLTDDLDAWILAHRRGGDIR